MGIDNKDFGSYSRLAREQILKICEGDEPFRSSILLASVDVSNMVVMVQLVKILRCGRGVLSSSLSDHIIYACEQRLRRDLISLLQEFRIFP